MRMFRDELLDFSKMFNEMFDNKIKYFENIKNYYETNRNHDANR